MNKEIFRLSKISKKFVEGGKDITILKNINWIDGFYRKDIGWRGINNKKV